MDREEAIDCLNGIKLYLKAEHIDTEAVDMAIEALSVDVERIGRWYIGTDGMMHCSNCDKIPISKVQYYGAVIYDMTNVGRMMHYCPHCGARMTPYKESEVEE